MTAVIHRIVFHHPVRHHPDCFATTICSDDKHGELKTIVKRKSVQSFYRPVSKVHRV